MRRLIVLLALVAGNAAAQYSLPAQQVLALAPQLEAFAGSRANFESLANGLHGGTEVRLVSMTREGMREIVTFTASERLPALDTARCSKMRATTCSSAASVRRAAGTSRSC